MGASLLAGPNLAAAAGASPAAADAFVDSVGLCVHLDSPPYDKSFDAVSGRLAELGVRHLRDELRPSNDLARWRALHERAGIRGHLLVSPATNTITEMLDVIGALGGEKVSAVEGQNEGDSDWFRAQPSARPGWAEVVVAYQREVFVALRSRYPRDALPVLSPTVLDHRPGDMRLLRPAAAFCDAVALHAYAQGRQEPETHDDYAALGWYLREFRDKFKPGAPAMVTEAGYHTGTNGIPAEIAAKYLPRLLLQAFSLGIARTFIYELMDEGRDRSDAEQNYGLLTSAGEPKAAFHPLRKLLGALADPGPPFAAAALGVAVQGAPADVRVTPFQKRTGEVVVALWRAKRSWDPARRRAVAVAPARVHIALSRPFASAACQILDADSAWIAMPTNRDTAELLTNDTITLIRLTP